MPDGAWRALPENPPFDLGETKNIYLQDVVIKPNAIGIGGLNVYRFVELRCGAGRK